MANADLVNQLDLDGRVAGCRAFVKTIGSRRKGKLYFHAKWNCPASAWPGPVTIQKAIITFEREVRGAAQIYKGKFERVGGHTYKDIPRSQYRKWGLKTTIDCDPGYGYQIKIEVIAVLQSPTGIGGGTKNYRSEDKRTYTCKG